MKTGDKELILRLAGLYCEMANSPEGTPTSFTNAVKTAVDISALLETLDLAPLSEEKTNKIVELGRQFNSLVRNNDLAGAKTVITDLINFVSENVPVEQLAPEFSAFMGAPMTADTEPLSETSAAMMRALNKPDPDEQDMQAIRRGADLLNGLIEGGKIVGSFSGLLEGFMSEPA
jgi:hypothetical protein